MSMMVNPSRFGGDNLFSLVKFAVNFTGTDGQTSAVDFATGKTISFVGGARITTSKSAFGAGSSLDLSVTNHGINGASWLTVPDSADWTPGASEDYCWEIVVDTETGNGAAQTIMVHNQGNSYYPYAFFRLADSSFASWGFDTNPSQDMNQQAGTITTGFRHLCIRRISDFTYASIDGVVVSSMNGTQNARYDSPGTLNIGMFNDVTAGVGYFQCMRYTKGSARYPVGNFTPPGTLFPTS